MDISVRVQQEDFDLRDETERLRSASLDVGAVVTFSGLVRSHQDGQAIKALVLEHYPGMTEKSLHNIVEQAGRRWPLSGVTVIHRIGELKPGDQIVFVGVTSAHRLAAFEACEFMMDYLKTRAPFWKKCLQEGSEHWVESKDSDQLASERW